MGVTTDTEGGIIWETAPTATNKKILIKDLLMNYTMHCVLAHQLPEKKYGFIKDIAADQPATFLMGTMVEKTTKAEMIDKSSGKQEHNTTSSSSDMVYAVRRDLKCYNCQDQGHMARECTKPKKCRHCNLENHLSKDCNRRKGYRRKYCRTCKMNNHYEADCTKKKGG